MNESHESPDPIQPKSLTQTENTLPTDHPNQWMLSYLPTPEFQDNRGKALYQAAQTLIDFERKAAENDQRIEQFATELEQMAAHLRQGQSKNNLRNHQQALYPYLFPGMDVNTFLNNIMGDEKFSQLSKDYQ